jgi:hypothetical protein
VANEASLLLIATGAIALVAAAVWRQATRLRRIGRIEHRLGSDDPMQRIAGGELAVTYGLGTAARCLLPRVEHDADPAVRAAIALAVAHRQWEPGGSERVLALRMWAARELGTQGYDVNPFGPAFTRISDMGGPQRPPYTPPVSEPAVQA